MSVDPRFRTILPWAAAGELSGRIAHEANNLLAGILGQAEIGLLSGDPERMKSALNTILKSARELKGINEKMVGVSRYMGATPGPTNLLELLKDLFALLERSFTKAGITIDRRFGGGLSPTWCAPGSVAPVLLFGLRLALDSLSEAGGGVLTLEASESVDTLAFTFTLMPPDGGAIDRTPDRGGALTLELADALAREQGGRIHLERSGIGWCIRSVFPLVTRAKAPEARDASRADGERRAVRARSSSDASRGRTGGSGAAGMAVLVVDDEGPIRELLREVLETAGCTVRAEGDAEAALKVFGLGQYAMVMTDVSLPGIDGVALVQRLKSVDPSVVVVVLTGGGTDDTVRSALAAGAAIVLRKPFEISELKTIIERVRSDPSGKSLKPAAGQRSGMLVG